MSGQNTYVSCDGMTANEFNDRYPVGTDVQFQFVKGKSTPIKSKTRTPAWTLGHGAAVVSIDGRAGGVSLSHIEVVEEAITVSFDVSDEDANAIVLIAERACRIDKSTTRLAIEMDLCAAHANGCPLDLYKLLDSDDATFAHDVFGIRKYIDRETGQLTHHFLPRCSQRQAGAQVTA